MIYLSRKLRFGFSVTLLVAAPFVVRTAGVLMPVRVIEPVARGKFLTLAEWASHLPYRENIVLFQSFAGPNPVMMQMPFKVVRH